jgi:transmembrane sensor
MAAEPALGVEDTAAGWLARREAGLSVEQQEEFSRWLLADARHAEAVLRLETGWRFLQLPRHTGQAGAVEAAVAARVAARKRFHRRLLTVGALGGLAAAAALVFALLPARSVPGLVASPSVAVKPERQTLPDGSVVELNANAEIAVAFTPGRRDVRLVRGEAHFAVAKDATRPFVVTAGSVSVRAVGTAFNVRFEPEQVGVLVTEGRVAVERTDVPPPVAALPVRSDLPAPAGAAPARVYLGAGDRLTVPIQAPVAAPLAPTRVTEQEMAAALAWRGLRVEFTNTPLGEIVELFNRQNRRQLALGDEGLADIRISGIFWSDDPEGFSRLLENSAGLRATPQSDARIVLHR